MADLTGNPSRGDVAEQAAFGDVLCLSLACPQCGDIGWVEWKNLSRGIGCRKCGCTFLIGRDGLLHEHCGSPPIPYRCPRCKYEGHMPSARVVRGMQCVACQLPLHRGPDNALYGPDEHAELLRDWRAAATSLGTQSNGRSDRRQKQALSIVFCAMCGCAAAIAALWALFSFMGSAPETEPLEFTRACLAGDWKLAGEYLEDDAVQRAEFARWKTRYFASIVARHRPKGDRVHVEVVLIKGDDQLCVYDVKMSSPFISQRRHVQHWRQSDGLWRFDAVATLAQDGKQSPEVVLQVH